MLKIVIPLEIPSQNETEKGRCHFARARRTKFRRHAWATCCRVEMAVGHILPATGARRLHITAYRRRRCMDIANLIGGAKACIDGLVDAGLLLDDRDAKARITYAQELASKSPLGRGLACTVIDIWEA
jgi:hypothetical protein